MCPKVTEEYRREMRDAIVHAAEKVFARKGYYAASMDDIVKESGLSKGALYGYFGSKEDLFVAVQERQGEPHFEQMISAMHADASTAEKLTEVGHLAFRQQVDLNRDAQQVLFDFMTSAPRIKVLQRRIEGRYYRFHTPLAALVREGVERGEFRKDLDPDALASILMGAVDGMTLHWATIGVELDWDVVERTFLTMAMHGILATPAKARKK